MTFLCLLKEISIHNAERFMQLLFKHFVAKVFIYEEPNTSRGQWCGHVLKSVSWNFGNKILIFVGNFRLSNSNNIEMEI